MEVKDTFIRAKEEYKQTEVGVIPADWKVETVGELGIWKGGGTPSKKNSNFWNGDIPWVSPKDFRSSLVSETEDYITKEAVEKSSTTMLPLSSILLVMRSGILRHRVPVVKNTVPVAINQDLKALITKSENDSDFAFYLLQFSESVIKKSAVKVGTTVESIDFAALKKIPTPLPPTKAEQTAIARVLSDTDSLISRLETLIEKKRAIKQGAMHQLLKPKEGWVVKKLGELIEKLEGGVSVNSTEENVQYPYENCILKTSAIIEGQFKPWECKKIVLSDLSRAKLCPKANSIIFSRMNTPELVGECAYIDRDYPNIFIPDRLWQASFYRNIKISAQWLNYQLNVSSIKKKIKGEATGTSDSMKNISKTALLDTPIPVPAFEEQTFIAQILSDMDAEITGLEQKLAKYKLVKQGMMQELLTGKTRLV